MHIGGIYNSRISNGSACVSHTEERQRQQRASGSDQNLLEKPPGSRMGGLTGFCPSDFGGTGEFFQSNFRGAGNFFEFPNRGGGLKSFSLQSFLGGKCFFTEN